MTPQVVWLWIMIGALALDDDPSSMARRQFEEELRTHGEEEVMGKLKDDIIELGSWDAVKERYQDPVEMYKRVHFREKYVLDLLKDIKRTHNLRFTWPDDPPGSRSPTSDFDLTIAVENTASVNHLIDDEAHLSDDVKAARLFFQIIKEVFHASPAKIFDTNIYVRNFSFHPFRRSSSFSRWTQDVAALTKIRRYMGSSEWNSFVDAIASGNRDPRSGRYADFRVNLDEADATHILYRKLLFHKLAEGDTALQQQFQQAKSDDAAFSIIESTIQKTDVDRVLEAEYTLFLDGMGKVREKQIALKRMRLNPPNSDSKSEETRQWWRNKEALDEDIRRTTAEATYFAPEAYSSEGAFFHIVRYEQAGKDASALAHITTFELLCSMNEQAGDFLKDVNFHYKDDPASALVQSSKYLKRFYDAIALLDRKIHHQLGTRDWEGVGNVRDIVSAIEPLVDIRRQIASNLVKNQKALEFVAQDHAFGAVFGRHVSEIVSKVREHLAKMNAEFRFSFPMRPEQDAGDCHRRLSAGRRRLSARRHLTVCGTLREYRLSFDDDTNGKILAATNEGDIIKRSIKILRLASDRAALSARKSVLTVALLTNRLASQVRSRVASLAISEIAQMMVDDTLPLELKRIFSLIERCCGKLAETAHCEPLLVDAVPEVNTLNSGLFVLTLSHVLQGMHQTSKAIGTLSKVQYAIGLQMYVNLAGSATFVAADVAKFAYLVKLGTAQGVLKPVEEVLASLTSAIRAIGAVELAAGGLLSLVNIGFDIYELWETRDDIERSMAINHLVFDSLGAALLGVAMVVAEASVTASLILGAFLVPLAGLGIGISPLVGAFVKIGAEAGQVGRYFGKLREGFERGAYQVENGTYVPNPYSVIEKIDFHTQIVTMGSPYLSKSTHGSSGSGRINYFFWVWDQPTCNIRRLRKGWIFDPHQEWRKDVFDLRARMNENGCAGCTVTQRLPSAPVNQGTLRTQNPPSVFMLPISPQSIIGYQYFPLPGATTRRDYGFQTLRDLEGDDFDFDFYVFPSEYIINHMHQYFLDTTVTLVMNDVARVLVAPKFERGTSHAWNKLSYHIAGSTTLTEIFLQNGVNFVLKSPTGNVDVSFLLDATFMDQQTANLRIEDRKIRLDDLSIDYSALSVTSTVYLRSKTGLWLLNIAENTFLIKVVNAPSSSSGSLGDVTHYAEKLVQEHGTAGRFVCVEGNIEGIEGHIVYDTHEHILVYTNDPTPSDTIILGVQSKEFGCFASPSQCRVWCTNFATHEATVETKSFCSGTTEFTLGGFIFVAEKLAIVDITRVSKSRSHKESLHYRYLLSEENCSLVDIRHFAPINRISESRRSAWDARPRSVDSRGEIGRNPHNIVSAHPQNWVSYELLLFDTRSEQQAPLILNRRSWYHQSTNTAVILEASKVSIPLRTLTFMPLATRTVSSRQREADVLFHDSSSSQVFRYEHAPNGDGSGNLVILRPDVVNVTSSGAVWFGVSSCRSVVEFLSAQQFRIIGYTYDILNQNQRPWSHWWNRVRVEDRTSAPVIPFYKVESGIIKATRSWYLRQADAYVILDHRFNENGTVNCVGVTENMADALLVTEKGVMWAARVLRASDIPNPSMDWKPRVAPVEWTPSKRIHSEATIVNAQWAASGTTIQTENGLAILANRLTITSAMFTLRRLNISGTGDAAHTAQRAYRVAVDLQIQMPTENFVPVWVYSYQAYLCNVNDPQNVGFMIPNHRGAPLGVDDTKNAMIFFDAATRVLWRNNAQLSATFDFAVRFGEVLLATSSQEHVLFPKLFGVHKIAMELSPGVKKVTVPHSYNEVNELAVDSTNMAGSAKIELQLPWEAEDLEHGALHDVGNEDTTMQIVILLVSGKTLRWQGLPLQRLIVTFASTVT